MAGVQKGKTYEVVVSLVLNRIKKAGRIKQQVFWNEKPTGMTIEPDFTIGPDKDHPLFGFLVTHSGSAKNSDMKFWRNIGELVELKVFIKTQPRVFNIAFDSVIKEGLKKVQEAAFDGQLIVGDKSYGPGLQMWVEKNLKRLSKDGATKAAEIESLAQKDKTLDKDLLALQRDIEKLLRKQNKALDSLWQLERKRKKGTAPIAKDTFVRRGLSKFLIFEDPALGLTLYRGNRVKKEDLPDYIYDLNLATRTIAQAKPGDTEISNAITLLNGAEVNSLVKSAPLSKIAPWLLTLRNIQHLYTMGDYVGQEYAQLCNPKILTKRLIDLHKDPNALIKPADRPANWPPGTVWLMEYLIELIKTASGSTNGYGYAQLAVETFSSDPKLPSPQHPVYRINLPDWIHRRDKLTLNIDVVSGIASVLSAHLKQIGLTQLTKLSRLIPSQITHNLIEAKLCTYRGFEPLKILITQSGKKMKTQRIRSCFAEAAQLGGAAGKTTVLQSKATLINWQSVSDAGRDHKKKELCGRAVALRYSWDDSRKKFIPRPGVKKLILVVDGTWRQKDLNALARAGWDEIFYPDEMAKLKKSVI